MQTCDMNLALLQGPKRRHAPHRPANDGGLVLVPPHVRTDEKDRGITTSDRNFLFNRLTISRKFHRTMAPDV